MRMQGLPIARMINRSAAGWLLTLLTAYMLVSRGESQRICTLCTCEQSNLLGTAVDRIRCEDLDWIRLTDRETDLLDTTVYFIVLDTPIEELSADASDDMAGVTPGSLRDWIFINTEIRVIPDGYFAAEQFTILEFIEFDSCLLDDLEDVLAEISLAPVANELVLSNNPFPEIRRDMFLVNDLYLRLEGLNIGDNTFSLPDDLFDDFAGQALIALALFGLNLGEDMESLDRILQPVGTQLELLDLSDNQLLVVPSFLRGFTSLEELRLADNAIVTIDPSVEYPACLSIADGYPAEAYFPESLVILSIDGNHIETLDTRYIPRQELAFLDVSRNRISDLRYGFTDFASLISLDVSSNLLKAILPELTTPTDNPSFTFIDFSTNRLSTIDKDWLEAYQLTVVGTENDPTPFVITMNIAQNPYSCYCGFKPIKELIFDDDRMDDLVVDIQDVVCYLPDGQELRNIYNEVVNNTIDLSDLDGYELCNASTACDYYAINRYNCTNRDLARVPTYFPSTPWHLDLSHNNIVGLSESYLTNTVESAGILTLNLSHNVIGPQIGTEDFVGLIQLEEVYLSHNKIFSISAKIFSENFNLRIIDLSYNYITNICPLGGPLESRFGALYLPQTELYLQHNQIEGLPCNAFSMAATEAQYNALPGVLPDNLTWHIVDLSHNCIDLSGGATTKDESDFYLPADAGFPGAGVREITGRLDYSNNLITNFTSLMIDELGYLRCLAELNIENNLVDQIGYVVIEKSLKTKWDQCGSSLRLGENPYTCDCAAIDFWTYYNQTIDTSPDDLAYINFTSSIQCEGGPAGFEGQILYEIDYPSCACDELSNPCFLYTENPAYFSQCIEDVFSDPPTASCGPCPEGFSGDGITCTVVSLCVEGPCFTHPTDPSLLSVCSDLGPDNFTCGTCPSGMTGSGLGVQGCQDVDNCQIYGCYSDAFVSLNCTDLPPPSNFISCGECPEGLQSVINGIECNTAGQCCVDDNPCLDSTDNYCFQNETCVNLVWPQVGIRCGDCPLGTRDLFPLTPGRYCVEINGCNEEPCYDNSDTPASCEDVPWDELEMGDDPFSVTCTCALGMTGLGLGRIYGCFDMDGCEMEPCWDDLSGLGVQAECDDVMANVNMTDPLQVTCTCPAGTIGDGFTDCDDTNPCSGVNNPCYILNTCSIITPPLDDVTCGPCPVGYTGDGRTCTDIDECSEATACHPSLACVPVPAPHIRGDYTCLGECPCGMRRENGGKGVNGCVEFGLCDPSPCSVEETCVHNFTASPPVSCGACAPGTTPVPDCDNPGTKACCSSFSHFSLRINPEGVNRTLLSPDQYSSGAGVLQVYYNGEWGDAVYPIFTDADERQSLLVYTADAACRALGYATGNVLSRGIQMESEDEALLSLMCREAGLDIMSCDWSEFYTGSSDCVPELDRHYITCGYGVAGYQLFGYEAQGPQDGEVYVTYYPESGSCDSLLLPVCYIRGEQLQRTAVSACSNQGYPGPFKILGSVSNPIVEIPFPFNNSCAEVRDGQIYGVQYDADEYLYVQCHVDPLEFRLSGPENHLQMRIGDYSANDEGEIYWGYLPIQKYINLVPGFSSNSEWDAICQLHGYDHMLNIVADTPPDAADPTCGSWDYWFLIEGHTLFDYCNAEMIQLDCAMNPLQVRVVDVLQREGTNGRVEALTDGLWSTLAVPDYTYATSQLASVACKNAGFAGVDEWISSNELTNADLAEQYGNSIGAERLLMLSGNNSECGGAENNLLECDNNWTPRESDLDPVDDVYGRFRPVGVSVGYPLIVKCAEDEPLLELLQGHYGEATLWSNDNELWEGLCVDFDPLCAIDQQISGGPPDSRLATTICKYLGYSAGFAIPVDEEYEVELPNVVFGSDCEGSNLLDCERQLRMCNLTGGDYLLAVRCYDVYDACAPETNTCFWNESCVDLPQSDDRLCSCPSGYEGDGYICTDIDECSPENNPCFEPPSCVPVSAPSVLGVVQTAPAACSPCPDGTEDGDVDHPGRICLEKNGCLPNICSRYSECLDVIQNPAGTSGYTCSGGCGEGYLTSTHPECLDGIRPAGSQECCMDADACAGEPCGQDVQCYDLPAPASQFEGYTCGECPEGSVLRDIDGTCQDMDYCNEDITPCDENAFCEDLPPPSLTARCQCHAGYLQNTTGVHGKCPEVDMCSTEPGVCGIGRQCTDAPPPDNPSLQNSPATFCSSCLPGYKGEAIIDSFFFSLEQYEAARQNGESLSRDCAEYDACIELELLNIQPCYKFPGNSAYDAQCIDIPADEYVPGTAGYRCGPCPPGMTGNGFGPGGCQNIDACLSNLCDPIAVGCTDHAPPRTGFTCQCPNGTVPLGEGNVICQEFDACRDGNNACMFPNLCTDLPYTEAGLRFYTCACPNGMYHVSERACGDIDGCIGSPCYGGCHDVPYTDLLIIQNPGSVGDDYICDACPHGMEGSGVGRTGCTEINLCESAPLADLLCYTNLVPGLSAQCADVHHTDLLPTEPSDLYRCICPPGMEGDGYGHAGCTDIDYCERELCGDNTICTDFPPPSISYTCDCAAGYTRQTSSGPCVDENYCTSPMMPCDPRMTCTDLAPPDDAHSSYHPIVSCSSCPVGFIGDQRVVFISRGSVVNRASCTEIDGCLLNDTCWFNPQTQMSDCTDIPGSQLRPWNTGYEIVCGACPHGMTGSGDTAGGQSGCTDVNGCEVNRCFVGVECIDMPWYDLRPSQREDDYTCGACPGDLRGDGKSCFGGCDLDTDLCLIALEGRPHWYREVGLLDRRIDVTINNDPGPAEGPLFDHTKPLTTKGYYLTVQTYLLEEGASSSFSLPTIRGPAAVHVLFYAYYHGAVTDGTIYIKQYRHDGSNRILYVLSGELGNDWVGFQDVYAWDKHDFVINFEYYRTPKPSLPIVSREQRLYVALDDIIIDNIEETECTGNQLCYNADVCLRHPTEAASGKGYDCYCTPGYTGEFCETMIQACDSQPCQGGASCATELGVYTCVCPSTLTGRNCEEDVDECSINSVFCGYGGTCVNIFSDFACLCPPGFTGKTCEENLDDCQGIDCGNGECFDLVEGFECICNDGWSGSRCNVNERQCSTSPCLQNALCTDDSGPLHCRCPAGFSGRLCEINIDDCEGVYCRQNAQCIDLVHDFQCDCPPGYGGKRCERDIGECENNPCQGQGDCYEGISDPRCLCTEPGCRDGLDCTYRPARYLCDCYSGYTGAHCETRVDYCSLLLPCKHGRCEQSNNVAGYTCACDGGWQGQNCDSEIDECRSEPCRNQARCYNLLDDFACTCQLGFAGKDCSININECSSHVCENGATCRDLINGYECLCTENYVGQFCQLFVIEYITPNTTDDAGTSAPETARQAVIVPPQSSEGCRTFSHLSKRLQYEIIGYTLLSLLLVILLLLAFAVCRIRVPNKEGYDSQPSMVTRYVQNFPFYGGQYRQVPPPPTTSSGSNSSSSGESRSRKSSRRTRGSHAEGHRYRFSAQPDGREHVNQGYAPYFY